MTLVYDLQGTQSRHHAERGIARYILELALGLERRRPGLVDVYTVNPDLPIPPSIEPLLAKGRVRRTDDACLEQTTVYHLGSPFENGVPAVDLLPLAVRRAGAAVVATVYDLIPLIYADHYLQNEAVRSEYRRGLAFVRMADEVLAISAATARDAVTHLELPEWRVHVVGAGTSSFFRRPSTPIADVVVQAQRAVPGLRAGYVLMPTGIDFRKNVEQSIEAYASLAPSVRAAHQLVITCRVDAATVAQLRTITDRLGVTGDVVLTGFVDDPLLVRLYQGAHLVIFPSRYEGFGLPPLEARRCGAPVICGDNSSLVEVITNSDARFDADDTDAIATVLRRCLTDEAFRRSLVDDALPDFSWDRCADLTAAVYDRLLSRPRSAGRRPRLGFATILPPTPSGVADHSYQLVAALAEHADVTVFVPGDTGCDRPPGVPVLPLELLDVHVSSALVDRVVYCLGNNAFHSPHLEALARVPGAVFLHDVRLVNAVDGTLNDGRTLADALHAMYPHRYEPSLGSPGRPVDFNAIQRQGILLARDAVRRATTVLVSSQHAATLVRLDAGVEAVDIGPLACRHPDDAPAPSPQAPTASPVVASFGIVSSTKQSAKLVDALPELVRRLPTCRLVLAGQVDPRDRERFLAAAHAAGLGDHLRVTGALQAEEFAALQATATVAVQLRDISNGESSAAVNDCLAAGVPTVVTALGSARELPDDVVVKVERDITADELAAVVAGLVDDLGRCERLRAAGRRYATEHDYADTARKMLAALFPDAARA